MSFLFSHTCSALHNLPGENSAWNHSTQQLNFSCWSITSPSFILPGQWKRNHFLHGTGAPLFFFSLMLDLYLELTINKSLLNDNSSSVCSQRSHEREMMLPLPLKKRKMQEKKKNTGKTHLLLEPSLSLHSVQQSLCKLASILSWFHGTKCGKNAQDVFLMPCSCLLMPSSLKAAHMRQHLCYLRNTLAKNNPAHSSRLFTPDCRIQKGK